MTSITLVELQAQMDAFDDAPAEMRLLLRDFSSDEIVKAATAIGSTDTEVVGRFLRATERMAEKTKMAMGEQYLRKKGTIA